MTTSHPPTVYAQRRARLAAQLGAGGIAIIPTAPERTRNRDSEYLFRFDSYFYYLTGFTEPRAWLVLTAEGHTTLDAVMRAHGGDVTVASELGKGAAFTLRFKN